MSLIKNLVLSAIVMTGTVLQADADESELAKYGRYKIVTSDPSNKIISYEYGLCEQLYDKALHDQKSIVHVVDTVILTHRYRLLFIFPRSEQFLRSYAVTIGAMRKPIDKNFRDKESGFVYVGSVQALKDQIDVWRFKKNIQGPKKCAFFDGKVMMLIELKMVIDQQLGQEEIIFADTPIKE